MRKCICKKCGREFQEDDSNPNIHYSNPAVVCISCEIYSKKKVGEYYQDKNGNYIKKVEE